MKLIKKWKEHAGRLKRELTALYYAYQNPALGLLPKGLILLTLAYALSPIDLIPDFIPVLGYLDDLIILPVLIVLSIKLIPPGVLSDAREKARNHPLKLKENWVTAVLFITIWVLILFLILRRVLWQQ